MNVGKYFKERTPIVAAMMMATATTIGSQTAVADVDHKIYPGSYCQSSSVGYSTLDQSLGTGFIGNRSPNRWAYVRCSVIRDFMSTDSRIKRVHVSYYNPGDWYIVCTLTTRLYNGDKRGSRAAVTNPGSRQSVLTIENDIRSTAKGYSTLSCYLPFAESALQPPRITSIRIEEES